MICSTGVDFDPPTQNNKRKAGHFSFTCYVAKGMKPPHEVREGFPKILSTYTCMLFQRYYVKFCQLLL